MKPSMGPKKEKQIKTAPHLIIEIKDGWHFDEIKNQFFSDKHQHIEIEKILPPKCKIERRTPQLVKNKKLASTEHDIRLIHFFTLLLPHGSDPSDYIEIVNKWSFVENVDPPPLEVSLP